MSRRLAESTGQVRCGRVRMSPDVEVRARVDTGQAYLHGLTTCGSWSACPVCANKIATRRAGEVAAAIRAHHDAGGRVLFVTLTAPHDVGDALKPFYEALSESFAYCRAGSGWTGGARSIGWKERLGFVGTIRATDATHGFNGWHPHFHVLYFVRGDVTGRELVEFRRWLRARWGARLVKKHHVREPARRIGVRMEVVHSDRKLGTYISKLGLGRELSSMGTKDARRGHRTPFQILVDFSRTRRSADKSLWREWTASMHGKNALVWSKGLRYRLIPDLPDVTDAEAAELPDVDPDTLVSVESRSVCKVRGVAWDRLAGRDDVALRVLRAAETAGAEGVRIEMADMLRTAPERPPGWFQHAQAAEDRTQQRIRFDTAGREMAAARRATGLHGPYRFDGVSVWYPGRNEGTPDYDPPSRWAAALTHNGK